MAGLKKSDRSPVADALLLAALFLPFVPIVLMVYAGAFASIFGCSGEAAQACVAGGIDFNRLYADAAAFLRWSTQLSAAGPLMAYLALLGLLAQCTTWGLRGRIVRTFAVIMWAGMVPLALGLSTAIVSMPDNFCRGQPCSVENFIPTAIHLGGVISNWLATNAVPLAVLATLLVVLTMGYRWLIVQAARLIAGKHYPEKTAATSPR